MPVNRLSRVADQGEVRRERGVQEEGVPKSPCVLCLLSPGGAGLPTHWGSISSNCTLVPPSDPQAAKQVEFELESFCFYFHILIVQNIGVCDNFSHMHIMYFD